MFNLGGPEVVIIAVIVVWFVGAKRLKELARKLGEGSREVKKIKEEIEGTKGGDV